MMRIKKGKYRIKKSNGWTQEKGSAAYDYPLMIHRKDGQKRWTVTHMATGYSVKGQLSLRTAKELISRVKHYPIFLMPTIETWNLQMKIMQAKNPKEWDELKGIIASF